jgi:hypothetical protein
MARHLAIALVLVTLAACGGESTDKQAARDTLTQRQKDSILGNSRIPGASGVKRAMTAADSTSAGIQRANAVATDTNPQ